jgi:hypothetical protein
MFRAVIAGHGAEIVHSSILRTVIAAWLLGVPNHHDLGRAHSPLLFRRYRC